MKHLLIFAMTFFMSINCISNWAIQVSGTQADLFDVLYLTETTGIVVGGKVGDEYGIILRTTNAGQSWDSVYGGSRLLRGIAFTDMNTGFVVGNTGAILKTTNGGINWSQLNSGTTQHLRSVSFPPTATGFTGFVCGFSGMMLKTEDGGANWITQQTGVTKVLFSIHFYDAVTGISVGGDNSLGDQPVILKTTNGGMNWISQTSPLPFALRGIFLIDQNNSFAAGNDNALIRTSDGGSNWNSVTLPGSRYLRDVYFQNNSTGYVCGNFGYIIKTTDGGATWDTTASLTTRYLEAIHFLNVNSGSAVGHGGTILKYTFLTGALNSNTVVKDFNLSQNFPNPFNPSTVLKYELGIEAGVTLKVFDLRGNVIKTLVNMKQQPGSYSVIFDKGDLPSGVYFYRLRVNTEDGTKSFSQTKQMMLLK